MDIKAKNCYIVTRGDSKGIGNVWNTLSTLKFDAGAGLAFPLCHKGKERFGRKGIRGVPVEMLLLIFRRIFFIYMCFCDGEIQELILTGAKPMFSPKNIGTDGVRTGVSLEDIYIKTEKNGDAAQKPPKAVLQWRFR